MCWRNGSVDSGQIARQNAVHALLKAGQSTKEGALQLGVTPRTIQRIAREPPVEEADDAEARRRRAVGRPAYQQAYEREPERRRIRAVGCGGGPGLLAGFGGTSFVLFRNICTAITKGTGKRAASAAMPDPEI